MWTIRLRFTRCSFFLHCPASRNVLVANQSWNSNKIQSLKELCTTKASNCIRKLSIELLLVNCLSFVIPKPVDKRTCRREFHTIGYFDTLFFSIVLVRDRCLHCTSCSKQNNWSLKQWNLTNGIFSKCGCFFNSISFLLQLNILFELLKQRTILLSLKISVRDYYNTHTQGTNTKLKNFTGI